MVLILWSIIHYIIIASTHQIIVSVVSGLRVGVICVDRILLQERIGEVTLSLIHQILFILIGCGIEFSNEARPSFLARS